MTEHACEQCGGSGVVAVPTDVHDPTDPDDDPSAAPWTYVLCDCAAAPAEDA